MGLFVGESNLDKGYRGVRSPKRNPAGGSRAGDGKGVSHETRWVRGRLQAQVTGSS